MKTKTEKRRLISYYELSSEWQLVAQSNLENYEDASYVEPLDTDNPVEHALIDLDECIRSTSEEYDGIIQTTNTGGLGIKLLDNDELILTYISF